MSTAEVSATSKPIQVKLVLLGEAAVGKSSVVLRFVSNDFNAQKEPTIGAGSSLPLPSSGEAEQLSDKSHSLATSLPHSEVPARGQGHQGMSRSDGPSALSPVQSRTVMPSSILSSLLVPLLHPGSLPVLVDALGVREQGGSKGSPQLGLPLPLFLPSPPLNEPDSLTLGVSVMSLAG